MSFADTEHMNTNYDPNFNANTHFEPDSTIEAIPENPIPEHPISGNPVPDNPIHENPRRDELYVGSGLKLKLEVSVCDLFKLEGDVEGKVHAKRMEMSDTGKFVGEAQVETACIDGIFEGSLTVLGLLRVGRTGRVNGKIHYQQIEIERNGQVRGQIDMISDQDQTSAQSAIAPVMKTVEQLLADVTGNKNAQDKKSEEQKSDSTPAAKDEEKKKKFLF